MSETGWEIYQGQSLKVDKKLKIRRAEKKTQDWVVKDFTLYANIFAF